MFDLMFTPIVKPQGDGMHTTGLRGRPTQNHRSPTGIERNTPFAAMVVLMVACAPAAWSQTTPVLPALTADQVVQRLIEKNKERAEGLQRYSGRRSYQLEYRGFPAAAEATMEVEVNFEAPASKRFTIVSATGSKLIQNRVFRRLLESEQQAGDSSNRTHTELGPDNYSFSLAGTDGTNYVLNVEPKAESRFLYRGKIWVDAHDFAVTQIEAQPARNPSFWTTKSVIHHTYQKVDDGFYLPKENKTVTSVRLGGVATLTIEYQSYQVTAARPVATMRKSAASAVSDVWPEGGFNQEVANFVAAKK